MTTAKWSWQELRPSGQALLGARSSHAVSVVGDTVYVFGGEHQARTTIDSRLLALDIYNTEVTYFNYSSGRKKWKMGRLDMRKKLSNTNKHKLIR